MMNEQMLHDRIAYMMIIQAIPIFFTLLHIVPGKKLLLHSIRILESFHSHFHSRRVMRDVSFFFIIR